VVSEVWEALSAPWTSGINVRALLAIVLVGASAGALGCWIVTYRLAFGSESLAHALLPGLVLAAVAGVPLIVGGTAGMLVAALGVASAARLKGIDNDTAVAVVVTPLLGLGAVLALAPQSPAGLGELLFGDLLGVSERHLVAAAALAAGTLAALYVLHGRLLAVGFDRAAARALRVSATRIDVLLLVMLALTLLVAVQGLGSLLVPALLVGPAATARALARRMPAMMAIAVALAVLSGAAGLYLSYYAGIAAGAAVAAVIVAVHIAVTLARVSPAR
jgi:ABC-type Mn2+/Zn2+ transport system permease subunit